MGRWAAPKTPRTFFLHFILWAVLLLANSAARGQTASTGALIGDALDPSGRGIPHVTVEAKNQEVAVSRSSVSADDGRFALLKRLFSSTQVKRPRPPMTRKYWINSPVTPRRSTTT